MMLSEASISGSVGGGTPIARLRAHINTTTAAKNVDIILPGTVRIVFDSESILAIARLRLNVQ